MPEPRVPGAGVREVVGLRQAAGVGVALHGAVVEQANEFSEGQGLFAVGEGQEENTVVLVDNRVLDGPADRTGADADDAGGRGLEGDPGDLDLVVVVFGQELAAQKRRMNGPEIILGDRGTRGRPQAFRPRRE